MITLKPAFDRARALPHGFSTFALLLWALAIDDDRQRRARERYRRHWKLGK